MHKLKDFFKSIFSLENDQKRINLIRIALATFFIVGIFVARHLFISDRLYPLSPVFGFFSNIPVGVDYVLLPLLIISLLLTIFYSRSRKFIVINLIILTFLFLEDQGRIFPSFYVFFILFFLFSFYLDKGDKSKNNKILLDACRLVLVLVYFWAGVQKITPFFEGQISWILLPISNVVPFIKGTAMYCMGIIIPIIEALIGVGLLFKRTRNLALTNAIVMHLFLIFLIGPIRNNWNDSSWLFNLSSMFLVFILFYKTDNISAKEILFKRNTTWVIIFILGVLPSLCLANMWYSALSINVYSGNIVIAKIEIANDVSDQFPLSLQKYIKYDYLSEEGYNKFDINTWSEKEFNAEPYPEKRIFKNITKHLCQYVVDPNDIKLIIKDKLTFLEGGFSPHRNSTTYSCTDLN